MDSAKRPHSEPAADAMLADVAADAEAPEDSAVSTPDKKMKVSTPDAPRHPSTKEAREEAEAERLAKFKTWRDDMGVYLAACAMDAEAELGEPAAHMAHLINNFDKYFPATPAGFYCSAAENARRAGD